MENTRRKDGRKVMNKREPKGNEREICESICSKLFERKMEEERERERELEL